jgi:hypothetical protein
MSPLEEMKWHTEYARKTQFERLQKYMEDDKTNTIGDFINTSAEWQLDSLIRWNIILLSQIEEPVKKKPNKLLFWKK